MKGGLILENDELAAITGYVRLAEQRKWLKARGWLFEISATGRPIVSRAYADQILGATVEQTPAKKREWKPDVASLKKVAEHGRFHGKTPRIQSRRSPAHAAKARGV